MDRRNFLGMGGLAVAGSFIVKNPFVVGDTPILRPDGVLALPEPQPLVLATEEPVLQDGTLIFDANLYSWEISIDRGIDYFDLRIPTYMNVTMRGHVINGGLVRDLARDWYNGATHVRVTAYKSR